jgi:hypothetical protein
MNLHRFEALCQTIQLISYKVLAVPVPLYGAETQVETKTDGDQIQIAKM